MMFSDIFWLRECAIQMVSTFSKFWGYRSRKAAYRKLLRVHFLQKHKKNAGQRLQTEMGRLELDTEAY